MSMSPPIILAHHVPVRVKRLPHAEGLPLPSYATAGAAAMDLAAAVQEPMHIFPRQRVIVPTGLCFALPPGFEMQIRPRSGLAAKWGIVVANSPGTIDEDFRGEIRLIILNTGEGKFTVTRGDRLAQAVVAPVTRASLEEVAELDETGRGLGAFGSTGR